MNTYLKSSRLRGKLLALEFDKMGDTLPVIRRLRPCLGPSWSLLPATPLSMPIESSLLQAPPLLLPGVAVENPNDLWLQLESIKEKIQWQNIDTKNKIIKANLLIALFPFSLSHQYVIDDCTYIDLSRKLGIVIPRSWLCRRERNPGATS